MLVLVLKKKNIMWLVPHLREQVREEGWKAINRPLPLHCNTHSKFPLSFRLRDISLGGLQVRV